MSAALRVDWSAQDRHDSIDPNQMLDRARALVPVLAARELGLNGTMNRYRRRDRRRRPEARNSAERQSRAVRAVERPHLQHRPPD